MDLPGEQAARGSDGDPGRDAALETGDPDHEELVEIAGEDGEKLGALQQRHVGILGEFEHPGIEGEPGELAVDVPLFRPHRLRCQRHASHVDTAT